MRALKFPAISVGFLSLVIVSSTGCSRPSTDEAIAQAMALSHWPAAVSCDAE